MSKTYTGHIKVNIDVDTNIKSSKVLAEDVLQKYADRHLDLPKGVKLEVDDVYIKPNIIKMTNNKTYVIHPKIKTNKSC